MSYGTCGEPTVFVVDDDAGVRQAVRLLMESAGHAVACFDGAESFLHAYRPGWFGCLILDVQLGQMSGPSLHRTLNERGFQLPIIYLTAYGDVPGAVQAMRHGAVDYLTKPVRGEVLLAEVDTLLAAQRRMSRPIETQPASLASRLQGLSPRELEVADHALAGVGNKDIARQLGISHRTVEYHRTRILQKTGAASFLQLAALLAGEPPAERDSKQADASVHETAVEKS